MSLPKDVWLRNEQVRSDISLRLLSVISPSSIEVDGHGEFGDKVASAAETLRALDEARSQSL